MTIYRFKHPNKEIEYTWNLSEGLFYTNGANPVYIDLNISKGVILYRLLEFGLVNQQGYTLKDKENLVMFPATRTFISELSKMMGLKDKDERGAIIRTIPKGGYEWLIKVDKEEILNDDQSWSRQALLVRDTDPVSKTSLFMDEAVPADVAHLVDTVLDATELMKEKSRDFVGRDFVFQAVNAFIENHDRGYLVISGDPGIGKTSFMAQLQQQRRCVHHFNVRADGMNRADQCLKNLCAQIILKYRLPHTDLHADAGRDAAFLNELLSRVSADLPEGDAVVILVDALDEAEEMNSGGNPLHLPQNLPKGVFMVVTTRRIEQDVPLHLICPYDIFELIHDDEANLRDVEKYLEKRTSQTGIERYINNQELDSRRFTEMIKEKSEGNFMYLRHVIDEIEKGAYRNRPIADVPKGLNSYYRDHWRRMRGAGGEVWYKYKLPVVMALVVVREAVPMALIARFSGVAQQVYILDVLNGWRQFLHIRLYLENEVEEQRYRIYHASYQDYIHKEDVVQTTMAERGVKREVDLKKAHEKIADVLVQDLMDAGILDPDLDADLVT